MATVKMTFSLDEDTARRLDRTAGRLSIPKSHVVREAITEYSARADRLSTEEQNRLLRAFDALVPEIPARTAEEVDAEIEAVRETRRAGGRGHAG
jgi:predicted transcriptional regulator